MSRRLLAILALLAVAFAILTALAVQSGVLTPRQQQTAAIGGPFQMIDQTGANVDQSALKGKWSAVFFGFTYCPDACPTTLLALGQTEKLLGDKARNFQTVFVSLDPARDTPDQLRTYLDNETFPRKVLALTGNQAQVDQIAKAYRVYHQKSGTGPDYVIDHSTITYLMNPRGELACPLSYGLTPEQMAAKIEAAMKQGSRAQSC
ncbi:SCO family protein [Phenylobacterium deserti]|uniref:SCO family protein n=1 Tax=Phenylobacterium deserti TaxID=1914756 RepID=A0A328AQ50_9CAUL|nr:SCO family protein [Phenylobacterium deserti]RAK57130.1 SCO family protein [Phenylobacterium deserti]